MSWGERTKRVLPLALACVGLACCAKPALGTPEGLVQGGYDEATRKLESGFKILNVDRVFSANECYPPADRAASILRRELHTEVVIAPSLDSVQGFNLVNVVAGETRCDRLVLAIRAGLKGRVFVLDSNYGPVYLAGGKASTSGEALAGGVGPLRDLTQASSDFRIAKADATARQEVLCPDGAHPLGGGMYNATPLSADGEGIYPHSYERLGAQGGFHVTATLVDPSQEKTASHRGVIQVLCGRGLVPTASPHATTYVHRHETATVTARCPGGSQVFSGGFQRTNFTTPGVAHGGVMYGGDYITESRAVGTAAWRVSGAAVDKNGGELTAIAYCAEDPSLPLKVVSHTVSIGEGRAGTATTPRCPAGTALVAGGWSYGDSRNGLLADAFFTRNGAWAATGYGWFGSADLTAYGYCAAVRDTVDRSAFPKPLPPPKESSSGSGPVALYIVGGALALIAGALFLRRQQVLRRRRARRHAAGRRPGGR